MATSDKDFKIKNGLIVQGATATVDGNAVLTTASDLEDLANIDTTGVEDQNSLIYNALTETWIPGEAVGGGSGSYTISATPPAEPAAGDIWFDSTDGKSYIYYDDGDSQQWLEIGSRYPGPKGDTGDTGATGDLGRFFTSDTAPASPVDGDVWFNTSNGVILVYYTDADSSQWVESGYPILGYQTLDGLTDTDITSPSDGDALVYESSSGTWINSTPASTVSDLTDTTISTPADGQVLVYDSATSKWINSEVAGGATVSETAPANPSEGDLWLNATEAKMYVYYNDGVTSQWVAAVGGTVPSQGKVLQVVSTTLTTSVVVSSVSQTPLAVPGLSATITPTSTSSNILVLYTVAGGHTQDYPGTDVRIFRDSTEIMKSRSIGAALYFGLSVTAGNVLDAPLAATPIVYEVRVNQAISNGTPVYINRNEDNINNAHSSITLMEIAE